MKKSNLVILLFFITSVSFSQATYKQISSQILGKDRALKILLPRGYSDDDKKRYPVIYVFDADYLFEPVAGNVDYYAYWEDMPQAIVVGINQAGFRNDDLMFSEQTGLPIDNGAIFFEFIGKELIPYIENNYKTGTFRVAIGHGETANFINYYLIRTNTVFNASVVISPDFTIAMPKYISETLAKTQNRLFYYLAVSENDVPQILETAKTLDTSLKAIDNANLLYTFSTYQTPTHYGMPAHALPKALESIFYVYQPISKKEYTDTILNLETSPVDYVIQKYQEIKDVFGIEKTILINDFKAIAAAINKKQKWEYYQDLSKLANTYYPKTLLSKYYLGLYYEKIGEPKKAIKTYQSGYTLEEIAGITKDIMLEKAEEIKADFGY
jgi:predicted alpha/beta superfamily hydrolase